MGVDAKDIQCFVWKIVRFSMNTCYRFAQKHPFVSGVVLLFFLLYLFLPSVFLFLIYSSPVIVCITVFVRIHLKRNQSEIQNDKKVHDKSTMESKSISTDAVVSRNDDHKPAVHGQMGRRKNVKEKNKEGDAEGSNKDKGVIFATTPVDASIVGNQKGITEEKRSSSDRGESYSRNMPDAENIQTKDVFVGKIHPNKEKSKVVIEEKGSVSLDSGECSGLITPAAQIVQEHEDLIGKTSLNEESLKRVTQDKENHYLNRGESSSQNVSTAENIQAPDQSNAALYSELSMVDLILQKDNGVELSEKDIGGGGGEEEEEESSDEEETQHDGNNAVEWTADDQQNLMDLGDSELERNKRLESLIARRRARKLFKMANEKRGMESGNGAGVQIPSIAISRNNILNIPNNPDMVEGLQLPGSAPSILLPTRNPFDIPYDPYEERPNLTDDSFNEEFSAVNPKELLFCRHESFFLGPSFSMESQQDQHNSHVGPYGFDRRTAQGLRFSRYRTVSDMSAHDQLIDDLLASHEGEALSCNMSASDLVELDSQSPKQSTETEESKHGMAEMKGEEIQNSTDRSELQMETDSIRDNSSEPCSLASDEASEPSFHASISSSAGHFEPKVGKFRQPLSDRVKNSLTFTIPEGIALNGPGYDSSPSSCDKSRMEDRLFYRDKGPCHSPGYSIASDLQVEVSELGSPPLPIDGTLSPADVESSYDGDIEKDITSGSEELWGASSYLSGVEENESRSREVNEVSEDDILEVGFSGIKKNFQNPITSAMLPAQIAEQDKSHTSLLASSRTELPGKEQIHSKNPDNKTSQNVKQVVVDAHKSSNSRDALPPKIPEKALPVMESASQPPGAVSSKMPEELSKALEKSAEVNALSKVDYQDQVARAFNDTDKLKSIEERCGGSQISTDKEVLMDLSQSGEKISSQSSEDIEKNCDKHAEPQTVVQPELQVEENKHPELIEGDPPKLNEYEEVGRMSMPNEVQEEQNTTEVGVSGINQSFDNPVISVPPPQVFVPEQLSTNSSSCSSPRSVLPGKIQADQIPPLNLHQQPPNDVPQSAVNEIVRNNPVVEVSPESLIVVTAPESSQHLVADPVFRPSTTSGCRQSEEPPAVVESKSDPLDNLEADIVSPESGGKTHPRSVDDIKEKSLSLPEHTAGINPSKTEEKFANSNVPETMVKEEETRNSKLIDEHQGKLIENEAIAGPSNSFDGDEGSNVVNDSKGGQGESKTVEENKAANKPPVPAAETAVEKEPSDHLPQKSTAEDGTMHNVNEKVPEVNQEIVADQPEPGNATAVGNETGNKTRFIDPEHVSDHLQHGNKATAEIDIKHNDNEMAANEMSSEKSLIDQENVTDQLKPDTDNDKGEPNDLKKDDVTMGNLNKHNNVVEQSKPTEFEVRETKNEINTTA